MVRFRHIYSILLLLFIVGCSMLVSPQSSEEKLFYIQSGFVSIVNSAADMKRVGAISEDTAKSLFKQFKQFDIILKSAKQIMSAGGNPEQQITSLQNQINFFRTMLRKDGGSI